MKLNTGAEEIQQVTPVDPFSYQQLLSALSSAYTLLQTTWTQIISWIVVFASIIKIESMKQK